MDEGNTAHALGQNIDATLAAGTQCTPSFVGDYLTASAQWSNGGWLIIANLGVQASSTRPSQYQYQYQKALNQRHPTTRS